MLLVLLVLLVLLPVLVLLALILFYFMFNCVTWRGLVTRVCCVSSHGVPRTDPYAQAPSDGSRRGHGGNATDSQGQRSRQHAAPQEGKCFFFSRLHEFITRQIVFLLLHVCMYMYVSTVYFLLHVL